MKNIICDEKNYFDKLKTPEKLCTIIQGEFHMVTYSLPGHYAVFEKPYSLYILTILLIFFQVKEFDENYFILTKNNV